MGEHPPLTVAVPDEDAHLMFLRKLDNAFTHQMSEILVYIPDLMPQVCIILDAIFNDTSL
jgi:hypothetical protein